MFGHESLPSKIYAYACLSPSEGEEFALEQISGMHRYRNTLCEIERERREAVTATLRRLCPDLVRLEEEESALSGRLQASRDEAKRRNAEARARRQTTEERQAIRDIGDRLKLCHTALKAAKKSAFESEQIQAALATAEEAAHQRSIVARAASGLYWGNYLVIEQDAKSMRKGAPPDFHRWNGGEGRVAVQLQGGLSVADAMGCGDQRFRIEASGKRASAWVRVGSDAKKKPVWCVVPFTLHRPLPEGASIKWVYLHRLRCGTHWRWNLSVVVSKQEWESDCADVGAVGINFGWRLLPNGSLRIAYAVGIDGKEEQLLMPPEMKRRWDLSRGMRGEIDTLLDEAKAAVLAWAAEPVRILPVWFTERTSHLAQWRSPERMRGLLTEWEANRIGGDEEIVAYLAGSHAGYDNRGWPIYRGWWKRHQFLKDSESGLYRRSVRMRDELCRNFAAQLRRRYHTARIGSAEWGALVRRPEVEDAENENEMARRNRQICSPGRLGEIVRETFAAYEERTADKAITQRCCDCGKMDVFDAAAELVRTCQHCGSTRDQDQRAAINLLNGPNSASGEVVNENPAPARDLEAVECQHVMSSASD